LFGTTDKQKTFHPIGISLASHEDEEAYESNFKFIQQLSHEVLNYNYQPAINMADGSEASINECRKVFGNVTRLMCWAHVFRAVKKFLGKNPLTNSILHDLTLIQRSRNLSMFKKANELFLEKYKSETSFVAYYTKEWFKTVTNYTWFEGMSDVCSKNNALESTNRQIKVKVTEHRALPFAQFLTSIFNFVGETWSLKRSESQPNSIPFNNDVQIKNEVYYEAFKEKNNFRRKTNETYYMSSLKIEQSEIINKLNQFIDNETTHNFQNFDHYAQHLAEFNIVSFDPNNYLKRRCTCVYYMKNYICHHIIIIADKKKLVTIPLWANDTELQHKKKRGPKKKQAATQNGCLNRDY
jgi:hypothetical protein